MHVGEEQLGGVLRVHPELLEVAAALEALHAALDHEQRDAAVALGGIGLQRDDHEVGVDAVGDERLRAVDHVVVVLAARALALIEARSEPIPGSVIASAVISEPSAMPGSQRARCSSLQ